MNRRDIQIFLEQAALIFASFIWTLIILVAIALYWTYQDIQARWDYVLNAPPEALAAQASEPAVAAAAEASSTPTPWAGPGPTATFTATKPPTPTPTLVVPAPEVLPETINPGDPIPVIVHTDEEAAELGLEQEPASSEPLVIDILPTPTPGPNYVPQVQDSSPAATVPASPVPPPVGTLPIPSDSPEDLAGLDGIPTHLRIDSVGIDSEIVPVGWNIIQRDGREYSIWQVADYAVGWHKTTALLGQAGNTVMAGHHNVNGEVFRDLVNVEVGDKVIVSSGGKTLEYVVDLKTIVKEKGESAEVRRRNAQWIAPSEDERLTLVTCWPYTNNTHRVIVVAKPV